MMAKFVMLTTASSPSYRTYVNLDQVKSIVPVIEGPKAGKTALMFDGTMNNTVVNETADEILGLLEAHDT